MKRLRLVPDSHVAAALIGEPRPPTPAEIHHLASCPRYFMDVRRGRAFELRLAEAIGSLTPVSIPHEVLMMSTPPVRRLRLPSAMSLFVVAALIAAFGLVAFTMLPRGTEDVAALASGSPIPEPSTDPHLVVAAGFTWRISIAGSAIEIHRRGPGSALGATATGGGPSEDLMLSWDLGPAVGGGASGYLRCPRAGGGDQWVIFGHAEPNPPFNPAPSQTPAWTQTGRPLFAYDGPPATGQAAPDGLWLYVIDPARFDPNRAIRITSPTGTGGGFGGLKAYPTDIREPSGCFFSG